MNASILIVDDGNIQAQGLGDALCQMLKLDTAHIAQDMDEALVLARSHKDIAIAFVDMLYPPTRFDLKVSIEDQELLGPDIIVSLRKELPNAAFVAMSHCTNPTILWKLRAEKIEAYWYKNDEKRLFDAAMAARQRKPFLSTAFAPIAEACDRYQVLDDNERTALRLFLNGKGKQAIADLIGKDVKTIERRFNSIRKKWELPADKDLKVAAAASKISDLLLVADHLRPSKATV